MNLGWDEKKMLNIARDEENKVGEQMDEMLAIVLSCPKFPEGRTVAIVPMEENRGSGSDIADKINEELKKSGLDDIKIGSLAFDTTAKNSGVKNGAAVLFQRKFVGKEVLYLACRHHIFEIVLSVVWEFYMGKTKSSKDTFCNKVAKEFADINTDTEFQILSSSCFSQPYLQNMRTKTIHLLTALLTNPNSKEQIPRDDYREAIELCLVMLGCPPPRWQEQTRWLKCGATSNARWMHTMLYAPKAYAFGDKFSFVDDETQQKLQDFLVYSSLIHSRHWVTSSWGSDAAVLDLQFFQEILNLSESYPELSEKILSRWNGRHTWYLSEENLPLVFCSRLLDEDKKDRLAARLLTFERVNPLSLEKPKLTSN